MAKKNVLEPDDILLKAAESSTALANTEAESFSDETLEQKAKKGEYKRKEKAKEIFHCCNSVLLVVLYLGIIAGITILFYHWFSPADWQFLSKDQLDTIKNILFSALASNQAKEFYKRNVT